MDNELIVTILVHTEYLTDGDGRHVKQNGSSHDAFTVIILSK